MSHRPSPFRPACPNARLPGHSAGRSRSDAAARGFSFVELLFAVAVMGIGFIMLAALFPVGLQQTKLTIDETAAAAGARGSMATLGQIATALTQYTTPLVSNPPRSDVTEALPCTYAGAVPGVAALPVGQSRTLYGQVRSLRDGRAFADANPRVAVPAETFPAMTAAHTNDRRDKIWSRVNGQMLSTSNDRNGYALLYRRDLVVTNVNGVIKRSPADTAQVVVINAQVANQSAYTSRDVAINTAVPPSTPAICNLEPRPVGVTIQLDASGVYTAVITSAAGSAAASSTSDFSNNGVYNAAIGAVAEGTFVVISDDRITAPVRDVGRLNGRIYRIGASRPDLGANTWELAPGFEFTRDPGNSGAFNDAAGDDILAIGTAGTATAGYDNTSVVVAGPAIAYVLGRGFADPSTTPTVASDYSGPTQDVAIYTTFISAQ